MEEKQDIMRHSMSHVLAKAVGKLFKNVKYSIGPAIDSGFYYDFDLEERITPEDFDKIDKKMREIINSNEDFVRKEISRPEALKLFKDQPYKLELIKELPEGEVITIYTLGEDWFDLCRGPHVENTKMLRGFAFKINRVSGAYFRGDEKNKMLQRIYVYGFDDKQKLKDYIFMIEEAKKRDNRKLGPELGLYFMSPYAQGMPFYMPNGVTLKNILTDYWRRMHKAAGYVEIETPIALNQKLWEVSGHWGHYKDNMYTFSIPNEDETFAIKPMSCPGGMLLYKEELHSYKELPLRVAEMGTVHRHEASGTLNGLLRVRCFTQDDGHIYMMPEQIEDEIRGVMQLADKIYSDMGLSCTVELSTMPQNHIGEVEDWQKAEAALERALNSIGKPWKLNPGDGAFYGPKIDIHIKDSLARTWQCGTIQLDMQMPKRFELTYIAADGTKKEPVMIHRAILGSLERFMGIIIEHFAGAFPFWLAPVQVGIVPVIEMHNDYAKKVYDELNIHNIRCELNLKDIGMGKKVNGFRTQKVPYTLILGDKEAADNSVSIKIRGGKQVNNIKLTDFIRVLKEMNDKKALELKEEF